MSWICRLCLESFDSRQKTFSVSFQDEDQCEIEYLVRLFFGVKIDNDIPEICTSCEQRVRDFQAFKEQVLQNQERYYDKLHCIEELNSQTTLSAKEEDVDNTTFLNDYISSNLTTDVLEFTDDNLLLQNLDKLTEDTLTNFDVTNFDLDTEQHESLGSISTGTNISSSKENKTEYLNGRNGMKNGGGGGAINGGGHHVNNIQGHGQTNGRGQILTCNYCDRKFLNKHDLDVHRAFHNMSPGLPCICRPCNLKFSNVQAYETHLKLGHNNPSPMLSQPPQITPKTTTTTTTTTTPLTNGKTNSCPVCHKEFTSPRLLQKHKRVHANYKVVFKCKNCSEVFFNSEKLEMHVETYHQDNRPFACENCNLSFSNNRALKMHFSRVHNPNPLPLIFECSFCQKKFSRKLQLVEHESIHTNTYLYNCKHCNKPFRSRSSMYVHCTRMHPELSRSSRKKKELDKRKQNYKGFQGGAGSENSSDAYG